MTAVRFAEVNTVRKAPPGSNNVYDVHAFSDGTHCITAWRPSPEELVKINLGEPIYVVVLMAGNMPPIFITADSPFIQLEKP